MQLFPVCLIFTACLCQEQQLPPAAAPAPRADKEEPRISSVPPDPGPALHSLVPLWTWEWQQGTASTELQKQQNSYITRSFTLYKKKKLNRASYQAD